MSHPCTTAAARRLATIAADPLPDALTARQIIERGLGRPLGPIRTMPLDLRRALYLLALQLVRG